MLLIVLFFLALCPAASRAQPSASERMAARLRQSASQVRAQVPTNLNTLNMNAASVAYLREQVAKAQSRDHKQALRLELAIQLLRAGQTRAAIAELHTLQAQDLPPGLRTRVRDIYATVGSGGSFGASSLQQELGLGRADTLLFVEVTWPTTGQKQRFYELAMDQIVHIREGDAAPNPIHLNRLSLSSAVH